MGRSLCSRPLLRCVIDWRWLKCDLLCDVYRTKGRYGDGHHGDETQQQQQQEQEVADRFTYMSVLVLTQCLVSAAVARLGDY